ncbi:MAG: nucleotidyltransferase family protein [Saprospiraceae bacterium]|nr:nucleotidyltransferase family protein [Saprospiraceae bacterium]
MTLENIKNILIQEKSELHRRFGVSEIGVFGSWVRGEQKKSSDIDVLVDFDREIGLFEIMELEEYLSDIFNCKVDVAVKRSLRKYIGQHILSEVEYL